MWHSEMKREHVTIIQALYCLDYLVIAYYN